MALPYVLAAVCILTTLLATMWLLQATSWTSHLLGLLPKIRHLFHRLEIGVPSGFLTYKIFDLTCPACHHSSVVNGV